MEQLTLEEQTSKPEQSEDGHSKNPEDGVGSDAIDPMDTSKPGNNPTVQSN